MSPNPNGSLANLVAAHPANRNAAKRGVYSKDDRALTLRIEAYREELLALPHVAPWTHKLRAGRSDVLVFDTERHAVRLVAGESASGHSVEGGRSRADRPPREPSHPRLADDRRAARPNRASARGKVGRRRVHRPREG